MLRRLYIDNFKCFTALEVKPAQICGVVGLNGDGKSSLFEALKVLQRMLQGAGAPVNDVLPHFSRTRWDDRATQRFEFDFESRGESFSYQLELLHNDKAPTVIQEERVTSNGDLLYRLAGGNVEIFGDDGKPHSAFPVSPVRSFIPLLEPRDGLARLAEFRQWVSRIWLFSLNPREMISVSTEESAVLSQSGGNIAGWYRALVAEAPRVAEALRDDLAPVIPGLFEVFLRPLGNNTKGLNVRCKREQRTYELTFDELSDGQRTLFALYAIHRAIAPVATILFFDEPDNFIAQSELQPWLSAIRDAVADAGTGTLLVASHHPTVIDYLAADQLLHLHRKSGVAQVSALELDRARAQTASEYLSLSAANAL